MYNEAIRIELLRKFIQMSNLPSLPSASESGLSQYLSEIRKLPMLEKEEEFQLAKDWQEKNDREAAHRLILSHLRLVAKIAMGYRNYGLPMAEVISEGNLGLMQAVKKFDPDKGFRLTTYAMWWIRAAIQEYVLRSWSLVKMGTTAAQKKLFFNLRRIKGEIHAIEEGDLHPDQVTQIANKLDVSEKEVIEMNRRMSHSDASLNTPVHADQKSDWQDWIEDDQESQESRLARTDEYKIQMSLLESSMKTLNQREQDILKERRLSDHPKTLEDLAEVYKVSRERIRQIEARAFEKLQKVMQEKAQKKGLIEYKDEPDQHS